MTARHNVPFLKFILLVLDKKLLDPDRPPTKLRLEELQEALLADGYELQWSLRSDAPTPFGPFEFKLRAQRDRRGISWQAQSNRTWLPRGTTLRSGIIDKAWTTSRTTSTRQRTDSSERR
jgi:hypothetical protein